MPYVPVNERAPFNVRNASPEQVEAHIGDLMVEIERLYAVLDQIVAIARLRDQPESD
jgi:hypothetical protein